jgi:hypothetical protein
MKEVRARKQLAAVTALTLEKAAKMIDNRSYYGFLLEASWYVAAGVFLRERWQYTHHNRVVDHEKVNPRTRTARIVECRSFARERFHPSDFEPIIDKWRRYTEQRSYSLKFVLVLANNPTPTCQEILERAREEHNIHWISFGRQPRTLQSAFEDGVRMQPIVRRFFHQNDLFLNNQERRRMDSIQRFLSFEDRLRTIPAKEALVFLDEHRDVFFWRKGRDGIMNWDPWAVRRWEEFTQRLLDRKINRLGKRLERRFAGLTKPQPSRSDYGHVPRDSGGEAGAEPRVKGAPQPVEQPAAPVPRVAATPREFLQRLMAEEFTLPAEALAQVQRRQTMRDVLRQGLDE